MLHESLKQLSEWGPQQIQDYCKNLVSAYLEKFENLGFLTGINTQMAYHLCGIRLPNHVKMEQLSQLLQEEKILVSIRGNSIRMAPNVYNDQADMDRLLDVFEQVTSSRLRY
jgi:selenocysteine lyase/cysteine desulfurase